ncbi:SEC-C metal-binding domain-containing protein [Neobacillus notoginsengisoli]|uniref:SEC-C metal-binding domain-containing protein n=1 Tax=Neobacillus notoginsengisoli TaxID=1578198 RepID=UPI0013148E5D|nr:SEC-C metal-binding domain-containing protein [Neobacillus notoginsengisoli]
MVGRNDACPCGSGKKYKKCCGKNDAVSFDQMIDSELFEIQGDILRYTADRYENEIEDYVEEHLDNYPVPEDAYDLVGFYALTWFTTCLYKNGKTVLDEYLDAHSQTITRPRTREIVQGWRNSFPCVFRITSLDNGKFLTVEDIFAKESSQIKLLDTEDQPEEGDLILATVLLSEPAVFLGTFYNLPASKAEEVEEEVLDWYNESGFSDPKEFMREEFLVVLDTFISLDIPDIDPIEDLEWHSEKHREIAENFREMMEELELPSVFVKLGITLWFSYCEAAKPKISNPSIYEAALFYMITSLTPDPSPVSQKDLAALYGISAGSISSKYSEMKKVLEKDLKELEEIIANSHMDALWDEDDEDFFFDEEDDEEEDEDEKKIDDDDLPF